MMRHLDLGSKVEHKIILMQKSCWFHVRNFLLLQNLTPVKTVSKTSRNRYPCASFYLKRSTKSGKAIACSCANKKCKLPPETFPIPLNITRKEFGGCFYISRNTPSSIVESFGKITLVSKNGKTPTEIRVNNKPVTSNTWPLSVGDRIQFIQEKRINQGKGPSLASVVYKVTKTKQSAPAESKKTKQRGRRSAEGVPKECPRLRPIKAGEEPKRKRKKVCQAKIPTITSRKSKQKKNSSRPPDIMLPVQPLWDVESSEGNDEIPLAVAKRRKAASGRKPSNKSHQKAARQLFVDDSDETDSQLF